MNRRKAIGGILAFTGVSYASVVGLRYFVVNSSQKRGQLGDHVDLIAELVDVIIPTTTSPGAKKARVQDYIISYMEDCSSTKEYINFLNGLNDLQETCVDTYNQYFQDSSLLQKNQLLDSLDNSWDSNGLISKISDKLRGRSFFKMLKALTIEGYCTSYIGATEYLEYMPIPGKYKAVTNLNVNQKAWATK